MINLSIRASGLITHQPHVISQYSPPNSLWYFFGGETREAVVVQVASLLPERRQHVFIFPGAHPGQRLLLVRQQRRGHRLQTHTASHMSTDELTVPLFLKTSPVQQRCTQNSWRSPMDLLSQVELSLYQVECYSCHYSTPLDKDVLIALGFEMVLGSFQMQWTG